MPGGVYTSISGQWQLPHPSTWSLRYDPSWICNGQTPGALQVEQMAVYDCKCLGDGKLCNAMHCKSISWSLTQEENRDELEHPDAAKDDLVHSIWGMSNGELERVMLKQWHTLNIVCSNWYQVQVQVDKAKSHFIQSARGNIAELYDLHCFKSDAKHLEFIDSLLPDHSYLFPVAKHVEGGVHGPNPMLRVSKAANKWLSSTVLPGRSNTMVYQHQVWSSGESPE